jgi:predicted GIY-YIG superfamily endonuclease
VYKRQALYRFYDSNKILLYVGISKNLMTRFQNHYESKTWINQVAETKVEWFESRKLAGLQERAAIRWEYPLYNKQSVVIGSKEEKHFHALSTDSFFDEYHAALSSKIDAFYQELPEEYPHKAKLEWSISNAIWACSESEEELIISCPECVTLANSWWLQEGHMIVCDLFSGVFK